MKKDDKAMEEVTYLAKELGIEPFRATGETPTPETMLRHLKLVRNHNNRRYKNRTEKTP